MKNLKTERSKYINTYLKENYSKKSKNDIISDLGLSWNYIQKMAHLLDIKRSFSESNKSFSLSKLLDGSNISYYWIGFILADGHITKNNTIQINLNKKDIFHLEKLKSYLDSSINLRVKDNVVRCTFTDVPTIIKLKNIFFWSTNKTINPIILPSLKDEQLFSLVIGFIDGDGSINTKDSRVTLTVKCHKSWKNNLEVFYNNLTGENKKFNDSGDCSMFYISNFEILRSIKIKSLYLNLPIMNRKWNKINCDRIMKYQKYDIVNNLLIEGLSLNQIIEMGFSKSLVYSVRKKQRSI